MHRLWAWGSVALVVSLCGGARASDDPVITPSPFRGSQNPAFARWGGPPSERIKPLTPAASPTARARASDTAAAVRAQEEANFLRRMAVCDKLQQMANETGDESLEKQALALQQKAESVYKQRTAVASDAPAQSDDAKPRRGKR
jgi:cell division protein FtsN